LDLGRLMNLALMASFDEPLDIGFECWPPGVVEEGAVCGIKTLVAKLVMCVADKGVLHRGAGIELVSSVVLLSPKSSSCDEEVVGSANEMCEHIGS